VLARGAAGELFARANAAAAGQDPGVAANARAALAALSSGADRGEACRKLMMALSPASSEGRYEIGKTRMYFKSGLLESFEERRALLLQAAATEMERCARGYKARCRFRQLRRTVLRLQAARRMCRKRTAYLRIRRSVVVCQARRRGLLGRRHAAVMRRELCATKLQAFLRRISAMRRFARARCAAVRLQAVARRRSSRRHYLINLAEFREQAKLENQVKALQAKLAAQEQAANTAAPREPTVVSQPSEEIMEALQALAAENAKLRIELERIRTENEELRRENQQMRAGQSTRSARLAYLMRSRADDVQRPAPPIQEPAAVSQPNGWNHSSGDDHGVDGHDVVQAEEATAVKSEERRGTKTACSQASGHQLYAPLSHFWQDVPFAGLPLLKSGSEIHIKLGQSVLMVDGKGKGLVWKQWMRSSPGYLRSMAFVIERRLEQRSGGGPRFGRGSLLAEPEEKSFGPGDEGCLGMAFALRSALTSKYVVVGGLLDWYRMQVSGDKPEDAAVFTFVPMPDSGAASPACPGEAGAVVEYCFALRLLSERKMLSLRPDGSVSMVSISDSDSDIVTETMAAGIEYLRPCTSYEITVQEKQIGIAVTKDLPLRVAGFTSTGPAGPAAEPGPAELTGRVRVGDIVSAVNGQDVEDLPRADVLALIAQRRPVTLGFPVPGQEEGPL